MTACRGGGALLWMRGGSREMAPTLPPAQCVAVTAQNGPQLLALENVRLQHLRGASRAGEIKADALIKDKTAPTPAKTS
jgi:hypothetical protein